MDLVITTRFEKVDKRNITFQPATAPKGKNLV